MDLTSLGVSARELMSWQEKLANTAHQRQVADLKAAGLNPVLSAKLGGADTPSGATDLAELAGLSGSGGAGGSGGSGGYSGELPNGVNIGDYINSLNPNGTTRIGKISIPNWLLQYAYNKAVEIFGDNPTIAGILGLTPGGDAVNPEDAERAIVNEATRGDGTNLWNKYFNTNYGKYWQIKGIFPRVFHNSAKQIGKTIKKTGRTVRSRSGFTGSVRGY